jgi:hypothetical protein
MEAKARKALIDTLSVAANFVPAHTEQNRRWVVGKLIGVFEGRGESDAGIKSKTTNAVARAKVAVARNRDFKLGFKLAKDKEAATERTLRTRRVELLYGLIAHDPELADTANEKQLLFIAKRRYRVIERFQFFVNPNGRGYFRYPETCKGNKQWRVAAAAAPQWAPKGSGDIPIELVTPPAAPDILTALDKLFTRSDDPCKGNLLDCETTLSIMYMDSMREAKTPKTLLDSLYAKGSTHLCIGRATAAPIFSADTSAEGLFTVGNRPEVDMAVGDHVYLYNHGLYKVLLPGGSWQGEHALLTDCGNRTILDDSGFRFMGHGLPHGGEPGSVPRFYSKLLSELNTFLYRSYRIGAIFLFYMKSGGTAFPGQVTKETHTLADPAGTTRSIDFYLFDVYYNYPNFQKKVVKGKGPPKNFEHGFVVWYIDATLQFGIHRKTTIAAAVGDGTATASNRPIFRRPDPPANAAEKFDATFWAIPYLAPGDVVTPYFVFQKNGAALQMKGLEMADLYKTPFFRFTPGTDDVMWITRPKVDVGSAYTTFLTTKGAL